MKNAALFVLTICAFQMSFAGEYLNMVSREATEDDPNTFMLAIDGKTQMGFKELDAFLSCITHIETVHPITEELSPAAKKKLIADFLRLTETSSISQLKNVIQTKACEFFEAGEGWIELTNKEEDVLPETLSEPLKECLKQSLTPATRQVKLRKDGFNLPKQPNADDEFAKYCPDKEKKK